MPIRTRTCSWSDPSTTASAARSMPGLEFLRSLSKEHSAPIAEWLDFRLAEVEEGRVVFELSPSEFHYNPLGTVHGGVACTLCDSAMGAAVHSKLPLHVGYSTLELKVNLVRPITQATGLLRCEGKVVHLGARTATAEAKLMDAAGKLYAHASATCIILKAE